MSAPARPAFPTVRIEQRGDPVYVPPTRVYCEGMTLRDYFAGQALAGWGEAHHAETYDLRRPGSPTEARPDYAASMAVFAYRVADAMLEVREARALLPPDADPGEADEPWAPL